MGFGDADFLDDGDGGGGGKVMAFSVPCSICLEAVMDNRDRSWAKLQCGHQFHLDCIGSAFNIKGAMQCPNCRKIEKGQWLYAYGSRPLPDFNMDDWAHDEDMHDLSYSEMSFGVHWCPFSGVTRLPTSFDEGEFSSSASHPCPYIAYFGPVHPSSSASSGSVSDGSTFNNHWSGPSVPSEVPSSYGLPSMDFHYHSWDHSPPFATSSRIGAVDQPSIPSMNRRAVRSSSDIPRPGMLPFIVGHSAGVHSGSSAGRAPSSVISSMLPPYPGAVLRPHDRMTSLQTYFPQSNGSPAARTPFVSSGRRSSSHRGLAQIVPVTSSSDQSSGFYFFSSSSSGRTFQEPENNRDQFHAWEREHQPSYSLNQVEQDSIWGPFLPPAGGSEMGRSSGYHHRHGSERMPHNRS